MRADFSPEKSSAGRKQGERRTIGWLVAGAALLAGVILWLLLIPGGGEAERAEIIPPASATPVGRPPAPVFFSTPPAVIRPSPSPLAPPAQPGAVSSLGLRPGDRLLYDFSQTYKLTVTSLPGAAAELGEEEDPEESMAVELAQEGQLKVEVYSRLAPAAEGGWLVGFRLFDLRFEAGAGLDPFDPARGEIEREATRSTVLAEVLNSGRIRRITASALVSPEARTLWKDILARWQVILPEDPAAESWEVMEDDVTGKYLANYTRGEVGPPRQLIKRKLRYLDISDSEGDGGEQPGSSVQGETMIDLNPYQISIAGREAALFRGPGGATVTSTAAFSFTLRSAQYSPPDDEEARQMQETMESLPDELTWTAETPAAAGPAGVKNPGETGEIFNRLEDLFRRGEARSGRHVELAAELISEIRSGNSLALATIMDTLADGSPVGEEAAEEYSATLIGVLGAAGTPEAQKSLLEIIASPDWPTELRAMALQSLVQVENPIPEIDYVLTDLYLEGSEDYSDSAFMVLAAMGERLREIDPARREAIGQFILENMSGLDPTDQVQMTLALATIANLGPEAIPEIVVSALNGEDPYLREQAVLSLERIYSPAAGELIAAAAGDPGEEVRLAAVRMLGDPRRSGGLARLQEVVSKDPSPGVRMAAVMGISQWSGTEEVAAIATLREVAQKDPSAEVRQLAAAQVEFLLTDDWSGGPEDSTEAVPASDEPAAAEPDLPPAERPDGLEE